MFVYQEVWLLTPHRVAVHRPTRTAVIADPHLGYSEARRHSGDAVPIRSLDDQLASLRQVCATCDVASLVVAGDLCETRLDDPLVAGFLTFLKSCNLELRAVVPGNHDRGWRDHQDLLQMHPDGFDLDGWTIVHGDRPIPPGRVVLGHFHPAWRAGARRLPCYVIGPNRLALPAFSEDAAGGAVNRSPRWAGCQALSIDRGALVDRGQIGGGPRRGTRAR